jgi:glycerol-3-phosphate acyltransferase PlsY
MVMFSAPGSLVAIFVSLIGGYLLGSIPFGVIATRLGGAGDIREIGSGNIGATNVLRTGRRDLALITLVGDAGKGAAAVLLAGWVFSPTAAVLAGGAAFLGHLFPAWLRFCGGKGVAIFFGILLAVAWPVGIAAALIWMGMAAVFRFSSLAALAAAALAPVLFIVLHQATEARLWLAVGMALLIFVRHYENIRRLLTGVEPRLGGGKSRPAA